ncbi:MAG TPA: type II restriction endonuclease, partial [Bacteroidales bacterium]|nr:type II restriction endonuclease [Bacteroidales bacterium]
MINLIISSFTNAHLLRFLSVQNSAFVGYEQDLSELIQGYEKFQNLVKIGEIEYKNTDKLLVFTCKYLGELTSRSSRKNQYDIAKKALKEDFKDGAVFVFYDEAGRFRFSFIRRNFGDKTNKYTPWKRYTYFVEPDAQTNRTFIERIGSCTFESLDAIQEAFSVEKLTKDFYKELSNWYFWAIKNVSFPNNVNDNTDDEQYNSENIIRLITRLIFVWFLKQKNLVKPELFQVEALTSILKNFEPESDTNHQYYRAILQNLFFATLNQEIGHRSFAEDKGFLENRKTYSIKSLYRYENEFQKGTTQALELFSEIPFLNGGLFECLDNKQRDGKVFDWDGFSRNPKHQAKIPNSLFFAKEMMVDLSGEYNDKKMKSVKVSGIIEILSRYNFTIEENTPVEIEVALDPELLGKVFENLLGAFNPETQETARKQTGSFYTPREIVHYMVDESLVSYFKTKVPEVDEETLRLLLSYDEQEVTLSEQLKEKLIQATFDCKILDPACGSGAFP